VRSYADVYANSHTPPIATFAVAGLARCAECREHFQHARCTTEFCSDLCRVTAEHRRNGRHAVTHGTKEWQNTVVRVLQVCPVTALDRRLSEAVLCG